MSDPFIILATTPDHAPILIGLNGAQGPSGANPEAVTLVDAEPVATDASAGHLYYLSTASSRTLAPPTNPVAWRQGLWAIENTSAGAITISLDTGAGGFQFSDTIPSVPPIAAGKMRWVVARYVASRNRWQVLAVSGQY